MAIPTRAEIDAIVSERLAADPGYRQVLLADPRAALSALVGMDIPEMVTVTVHEESLTDIHLVLPAAPDKGELSENDLELVAGGEACWDNMPCID